MQLDMKCEKNISKVEWHCLQHESISANSSVINYFLTCICQIHFFNYTQLSIVQEDQESDTSSSKIRSKKEEGWKERFLLDMTTTISLNGKSCHISIPLIRLEV